MKIIDRSQSDFCFGKSSSRVVVADARRNETAESWNLLRFQTNKNSIEAGRKVVRGGCNPRESVCLSSVEPSVAAQCLLRGCRRGRSNGRGKSSTVFK